MIASTLVDVCRVIGKAIPLWTQGTGSNISCKDREHNQRYLWIKASGFRLDAVTETQGLAKVALDALASGIESISSEETEAERQYAACLGNSAVAGAGLGRPSMETGFHALLPKRWVVHFHSLPSIVMAHLYACDGQALRTWFDTKGLPWPAFVPAVRPGWVLSKRITQEDPETDVFILQNHGIILQADEPGIVDRWRKIEGEFCRDWGLDAHDAAAGHDSRPTPMKLYFPDAAVFLDRLLQILKPVNNGTEPLTYSLSAADAAADRDTAEIWSAIQWLHATCPELAELPPMVSSTVAGLPTEQFRRQIKA